MDQGELGGVEVEEPDGVAWTKVTTAVAANRTPQALDGQGGLSELRSNHLEELLPRWPGSSLHASESCTEGRSRSLDDVKELDDQDVHDLEVCVEALDDVEGAR